jgi:palmitoyltransferase
MYTACYCGVVLGAGGYSLRKELGEGQSPDARIIAVLALAGFFGLFTFLMTATSWRYIAINMTNVDILGAQRKIYQLAVRIPRGSQSTDKYHVVDYPLLKSGQPPNGQAGGGVASEQEPYDGVAEGSMSAHAGRDALATRTFAIVKMEPGENPWDLGFRDNWRYVMGTNILDWFLPLRFSPCTNHDSTESFYHMGPALKLLRARYGLDEIPSNETDMIELRGVTIRA